jgi:putative transposase
VIYNFHQKILSEPYWGSRFLPSLKNKGKKKLPGQMSLPWDKQRVTEDTEVQEVAEKFIQANGYNPAIGILKC